MEYKWDLGVDCYQNEKIFITELGHSDRLKIHVNRSKIYIDPGICKWSCFKFMSLF